MNTRPSRKYYLPLHICGILMLCALTALIVVEYVRSKGNMEYFYTESLGITGVVEYGDGQSMSVEYFLEQSSTEARSYMVRGHFTKDVEKNLYILFLNSYISVEIEINGVKVLTTVDREHPTYVASKGRDALMLKSEGITTSDEIVIRTYSDALVLKDRGLRQMLEGLEFGEGNFAVIREYRSRSVGGGTCLALIGVGIVLSLFFMLNYKADIAGVDFYMIASVDIIVCGLWCYFSIMGNYSMYFTNSKLVAYALDGISKPLMPVVLGSSIAAMISNKKMKLLTLGFVLLAVLNSIVMMLLEMFDVWSLQATRIFASVISVPLLFCYLYSMFELFKEQDRNRLLIILLAAPAGMGSLLQVSNSFLNYSDKDDLFIGGFLVSLVIFTVYLCFGMYYVGREVRAAGELKSELTQKEVDLMVSQIQPHFLFNALNSIKSLCVEDPEKAEQAVGHFAKYMRLNLDTLKENAPVPLSVELECVRNYLFLEQVRVGDRLKIVYEIEDEAVKLPALTIQPLAENAVRHGITKKREGGTLVIRAEEIGDEHVITVSDDGIGFDPSVKKNDGRSHVGMENVEQRLKRMVNGTLSVTSEVGKGTIATIRIPITEK